MCAALYLPDHFRLRAHDVTLQIQQVLVVVESRQPLQPQQGDAELSPHLLQLPGTDLETLEEERSRKSVKLFRYIKHNRAFIKINN